MIKIALAGTSGLAQYIAHYISTQTCHQFFFLSRNPNPGLTAKGWQVLPVDYGNLNDVRYKLVGVDTVISTVSGQAQHSLIDAAAQVHVRRFVPSEFEGPLYQRPSTSDPLDRGQKHALSLLVEKQELYGMQFAVFSCGIFYERFYPEGMASLQLGAGTHISGEGDYIVNLRQRTAIIPFSHSNEVYVRMTSAEDVARYVVAALDLPDWPREFFLPAERMKVGDIVTMAELACGVDFQRQYVDENALRNAISYAVATDNISQQYRLHHLMATLHDRYDYSWVSPHQLVNSPSKQFAEWLLAAWCTE
ncbi:hypothetical protein BGW36DRAFT_449438 [Talaromyces proteolyticus]|uniref:NmrA-like domain-containing protein n=1 Tax=Talaromyces proteolyticus TaxID=1131652 RepID=A0AAD4PZP6_9EURO|nr:uncharacterized protein BGW36DRAFT_449438 [Talaromyces proteolyticus]KAH8699251.1 hypothetical protein BGW36DRAFT_449438 [Talaromyces proteolyticus]